MLGVEGEAPASYKSLNDTNYLEQMVEGDADILLAYAELDKLDNLGLATFRPFVRPSLPWSLWTAPGLYEVGDHGRSAQLPLSYRRRLFLVGLDQHRTRLPRHGYMLPARAVLGRTYANCRYSLGVEDVMILQASMPPTALPVGPPA